MAASRTLRKRGARKDADAEEKEVESEEARVRRPHGGERKGSPGGLPYFTHLMLTPPSINPNVFFGGVGEMWGIITFGGEYLV